MQVALGALTPVLVELFTSEGCSSCPPADQVLADLGREQPVPGAEVIILSQHVDYWNRLGWRDPLSASEFSDRQRDFARTFRRDGVYTPQMVVDGRQEHVGSDAPAAREMIAAAARQPKAAVSLSMDGDRLKIEIGALPLDPGEVADVQLALTEDGLKSRVVRGENEGRTLWHRGVVRRLSRIGVADSRGFSVATPLVLDPRWKRGKLRAVAFVQRRGSGGILGVGAMWLPNRGTRPKVR